MMNSGIVLSLFFFHANVFAQQCSLIESCNSRSLTVHSIRAGSTDTAQLNCPPAANIIGIEWYRTAIPGVTATELITVDGPQLSASGFGLSITNASSDLEGEYFCMTEESGGSMTNHTVGCLVVQGTGYFALCPNGTAPSLTGCSDVDNIEAMNGEVEQLDLRVTFRDGGLCTNQSIRQLIVQKNSTTVYSCVNILSSHQSLPCESNDKFEVRMECPQCAATGDLQCCKYSIFLNFTSFSESDTGTYVATVTFNEIESRRRDATKTFDVNYIITDLTTDIAITSRTKEEGRLDVTGGEEGAEGADQKATNSGEEGLKYMTGIIAELVFFMLHGS